MNSSRSVTPWNGSNENFARLVRGTATRHVVEHLYGLDLVMGEALEGGVNAPLNPRLATENPGATLFWA